MREIRLWSEEALPSLDIGHAVFIEGGEHHHFSRVLRGKTGDKVILMDGQGCEAQAECRENQRQGSTFLLTKPPYLKAALRDPIALVGPLPKGKRFSYMAEKCQEVGCSSFTPLQTEHSVREAWSDSLRAKTRERLIDACKQSRNPYLMTLHNETSFDNFHPSTATLVLDIDAPATLPKDLFPLPSSTCGPETPSQIYLLFGPEAGWSDDERQFFEHRQWPRWSISQQHLRMETAAILGAGILTHHLELIHG